MHLEGHDPKELVLNDGSRLSLGPGAGDRVLWRHGDGGEEHAISVAQAVRMAGTEYEGYVAIRTRSEAQWLRTIAEWCESEAERLDGELERVL